MGRIERELSREPINDFVKFMKALSDAFAKLFQQWVKHKDTQESLDLAKKMEDRFFEGGAPIAIKLHGGAEVAGNLKVWMKQQGIGFLELGNSTIICSNVRAQTIMEMDRKLCIAKGSYLQEVSCKELENAIATLPISNKTLLTMNNLTEDEATVFKNKCEIGKKPNTVGIDKVVDEQGNVSYRYEWRSEPKEVFSRPETNENGFMVVNELSSDVSKAWLETMFSLYAWDPEQKHSEIDYDRKLEDDVDKITTALRCNKFDEFREMLPEQYRQYKEDPNGSREFYIIGTTNKGEKKSYIRLSSTGFTAYEVKEAEGQPRTVTEVAKVSIDTPNFEGELRVQMDNIYNETILTDEKELDFFLDPRTNASFLNIITGNAEGVDTENLYKILSQDEIAQLQKYREKEYATRPMRYYDATAEAAKGQIPQYIDLAIKRQVELEAKDRGIDITEPENMDDIMFLYQREATEFMRNPELYRENIEDVESARALDQAFDLMNETIIDKDGHKLSDVFEQHKDLITTHMDKNMNMDTHIAKSAPLKEKDEYDKRPFFARDNTAEPVK